MITLPSDVARDLVVRVSRLIDSGAYVAHTGISVNEHGQLEALFVLDRRNGCPECGEGPELQRDFDTSTGELICASCKARHGGT